MPLLPARTLDTVAMVLTSRDGDFPYSATGFFCRYRPGIEDAGDGLFLVTSAGAAREDLADAHLLCYRRRGKRPRFYRASGEDGLALGTWVVDRKLDLAVLPLDRERLVADAVRYRAFDPEGGALTTSAMEKRRIGEGDDVRILGFAPVAGLHIPLYSMVRRGIVARIQDCYRGRSESFLLDATILRGNRGSPVIVRLEHGVNGHPLAAPPVKLIGIVSGHLPTRATPLRLGDDGKTLLVQPNTGLVRVVPVDGLLDLLETATERTGG